MAALFRAPHGDSEQSDKRFLWLPFKSEPSRRFLTMIYRADGDRHRNHDDIVRRFQEYTGQQAVLEGGGTFDEVALQRAGATA